MAEVVAAEEEEDAEDDEPPADADGVELLLNFVSLIFLTLTMPLATAAAAATAPKAGPTIGISAIALNDFCALS